MISWRYHLISIVAFFLALALGVLAGTAVVNQGLVTNLKTTTDRLSQENADYRAKIRDFTGQIGTLTDYSDQVSKIIENLRLDQAEVVLVTDEGAEPAALDQVRGALSVAGATVVTTLVPLPSLVSEDPADTKALMDIIGAPVQTDPALLPEMTAQALATRLAHGPASPVRPGQPPDVLASLLSSGFIDSREPGVKSAADIGIPGAVIVVSGPTEGAVTPPASFMVPLVKALSAEDAVVAAGEARPAPDGFVALVRADETGPGPRVTVDDLVTAVGGTALIVGLQRAIDQRAGGDYGPTSGQLLPPLT